MKRRGFTFIELLIVMPIAVFLSIIAAMIIFRGWQAYQYSLAQSEASYQLVNSLDRVSRVVRSASSVVAASANDLTVDSYFSPRDAVPDRVRYYISSGVLKIDIIPASGTAPNYVYSSSDKRTITIISVKNGVTQPLFKYYDESGSLLSSPYDTSAIHKVEIGLVINPKPAFLKSDQSSSTQVQLRNRKTNL
ncbi:MAG: hypothetical protein WCI47_01870 [bacterium]